MFKGEEVVAKKKTKEKLDTYCSYCLCRQTIEKKIVSCPKGHDKVEGISKDEKERILERKKEFSLQNSINIQLGDDEGEHGDLFYRIMGTQGNIVLRVYRIDDRTNDYGEIEKKSVVLKSYGPHLSWVTKRILEEELTNQDAATLGQMLDVLTSIDKRLESLEESIFFLSEEEEEEDE